MVPQRQAFVDASVDQQAYAALNLRSTFSEGAQLRPPADVDWISYFANIMELTPKPAREGEFPVGVTKQGGTFVLQGDRVLFASADRIPGDEPSVAEVLRNFGA
mmetsp:Transcript_51/g.117  ORF Transcript_51/g.117 Transcript_51/m.117 type:complete len:104 (+) Transcript_51:185-496(+)